MGRVWISDNAGFDHVTEKIICSSSCCVFFFSRKKIMVFFFSIEMLVLHFLSFFFMWLVTQKLIDFRLDPFTVISLFNF